jgi:hypothetical protein
VEPFASATSTNAMLGEASRKARRLFAVPLTSVGSPLPFCFDA